MHCDQRQPGAKLNRPKVKPSSRTTSTRVFSGVRTSSGLSSALTSNELTVTGVLIAPADLVGTTGSYPPARVCLQHLTDPPHDDRVCISDGGRNFAGWVASLRCVGMPQLPSLPS